MFGVVRFSSRLFTIKMLCCLDWVTGYFCSKLGRMRLIRVMTGPFVDHSAN